MGRSKPTKPRDIGFNTDAMGMAVNANVKLSVDRYEGGKVARRMFSVFDQLATNGKTVGTIVYPPTLTKNMAVAGNNMFTVYAAWQGLNGAMDEGEEIGSVQGGGKHFDLVTDRMMIAGNEFMRICNAMKAISAERRLKRGADRRDYSDLLTAICQDMLVSDGAMIDTGASKPIVRWRRVVEQVLSIYDRDCQRDAIKNMCADLAKVWEC